MPLDAIFLHSLTKELKGAICGATIDKIQQPAADTVIFALRGGKKLLISIGNGSGRVSLTECVRDNPASPPMFCMLLRKYLSGAKILDILQPNEDRIVKIKLLCRDAMGMTDIKYLVAELMGRNSNLLLIEEDGHILDCMRRVSGGEEITRPALPGLLYRQPQLQAGLSLLEASDEEIRYICHSASESAQADKWILGAFRGMSPLTAREIVFRAFNDSEAIISQESKELLIKTLTAFRDEQLSASKPYAVLNKSGEYKDFAATPITQYEDLYSLRESDSFSSLLDSYYTARDTAAIMQTASRELKKTVKTARDRTARRIANQEQELRDTDNKDLLREAGDIISANIWSMNKGMTVLRADDFYSPVEGATREIKLDPFKTPQQNAALYYKNYNRAKTAQTVLTEQLNKGRAELDYLESVLDELNRTTTLSGISQIKGELEGQGIVKKPSGKQKRPQDKSGPIKYSLSGGQIVYVGRNNIENDALTLKNANKYDLWLHVKDTHGSHVVIDCSIKDADDTNILTAAEIAAYHSAASGAGKVAVDYTLIKHVRKPNGARPGRVIYTDYSTVIVIPDEHKELLI